MSWSSICLRRLGRVLGGLALAASLFSGSDFATAQEDQTSETADAHPAFAGPEMTITFRAGAVQISHLPMATGGDGALTYAIDPATPLPAGLAFDARTHTVRGAPAAPQMPATYRLVAEDADGDTAALSFSVAVDGVPSFDNALEPTLTFATGRPQTSAALPAATGGNGALTYAIDPATPLPAGLTFDAAARTVTADATSATSPAPATYRLVAADIDGDTAALSFALVVDGVPSFGRVPEPALTFTAGRPQTSAALPAATDGNGALTYAIDRATPLPAGLTFNAAARTVTADATASAQMPATYRLVAADRDDDTTTLPFTVALMADYDRDDDGLIEIATLAQLDAVRHDLDGDGAARPAAYAAAFPLAAAGMGCPAARCGGYELAADLTFDQNGDGHITAADAAYWNQGAGWVPIGHATDEDRPFRATFQGNGYAISHLFIHRSARDFVGLFFLVADNARIEGLTLRDVEIWGYRHVGGVAGRNTGTISASSVSGAITGSDHRIGGLAGDNYGLIAASAASATVAGGRSTGGLVGFNGHTGKIVASAASGVVLGGDVNSGGLVGYNYRGLIAASYATGPVMGSDDNVGGLVGVNDNEGVITASYATGIVRNHNGNHVGGLAGYNYGGLISDSYARGAVFSRGEGQVGGLVGANDGAIMASCAMGGVTTDGSQVGGLVGANRSQGRITASYAAGAVKASSAADVGGLAGSNDPGGRIVASYARGGVAGGTRVGGLVGYNRDRGTITASYARGAVSGRTQVGGLVGAASTAGATAASYWDVTASGQTDSRGGTGQTTQELQTPVAYVDLYAAWNLDVDGLPGSDAPWDFGTARRYPVLRYACGGDADTG